MRITEDLLYKPATIEYDSERLGRTIPIIGYLSERISPAKVLLEGYSIVYNNGHNERRIEQKRLLDAHIIEKPSKTMLDCAQSRQRMIREAAERTINKERKERIDESNEMEGRSNENWQQGLGI